MRKVYVTPYISTIRVEEVNLLCGSNSVSRDIPTLRVCDAVEGDADDAAAKNNDGKLWSDDE